MNEPFTIRQATLDDIPVIVTHRRKMFEDMRTGTPALLDGMEARFDLWLRERMENGRYLTWFAITPEGSIASGAGLWLMDWPPHIIGEAAYRGYLLNVYTEQEYRRNGLGRMLTQNALDWCWANNIEVVVLHASAQGRRIYEKMGFQSTNEMRLLKPESS